jgi:hypothetical protein
MEEGREGKEIGEGSNWTEDLEGPLERANNDKNLSPVHLFKSLWNESEKIACIDGVFDMVRQNTPSVRTDGVRNLWSV